MERSGHTCNHTKLPGVTSAHEKLISTHATKERIHQEVISVPGSVWWGSKIKRGNSVDVYFHEIGQLTYVVLPWLSAWPTSFFMASFPNKVPGNYTLNIITATGCLAWSEKLLPESELIIKGQKVSQRAKSLSKAPKCPWAESLAPSNKGGEMEFKDVSEKGFPCVRSITPEGQSRQHSAQAHPKHSSAGHVLASANSPESPCQSISYLLIIPSLGRGQPAALSPTPSFLTRKKAIRRQYFS